MFVVGVALLHGRLAAVRRSRRARSRSILARGAQGIGGAAMFATSLALLAQEFHGRERGDRVRHLGRDDGRARWRSARSSAARSRARSAGACDLLPQPADRPRDDLHDPAPRARDARRGARRGSTGPGLVTFSAALFVLVFALIRGNEEGWGSPPIVTLLAGSVAAARALSSSSSVASERPMLDLELFRKRDVQRRLDRRLRAVGVDVRDVPLHHALRADDPRLRPVRDRAALPAADGRWRSSRRRSPASSPRSCRRGRCSARGSRSSAAGCCSWRSSTPARTGRRCCPGSSSPASASG